MLRVTIAASLMLAVTTATGQVDLKKEIAECYSKSGDLAKMNCYDTLARKIGVDGPQVSPVTIAGVGKWQVSDTTNPMDDTRKVTIFLHADSGTGQFGGRVRFAARCQSNKTEAWVSWNDFMGTDAVSVTYRVGDEEAKKYKWGLSTDNKATYIEKPIPLLKQMMVTNKFIAQATPYNESPITAIFDTQGMENALKPLRETCGW